MGLNPLQTPVRVSLDLGPDSTQSHKYTVCVSVCLSTTNNSSNKCLTSHNLSQHHPWTPHLIPFTQCQEGLPLHGPVRLPDRASPVDFSLQLCFSFFSSSSPCPYVSQIAPVASSTACKEELKPFPYKHSKGDTVSILSTCSLTSYSLCFKNNTHLVLPWSFCGG